MPDRTPRLSRDQITAVLLLVEIVLIVIELTRRRADRSMGTERFWRDRPGDAPVSACPGPHPLLNRIKVR